MSIKTVIKKIKFDLDEEITKKYIKNKSALVHFFICINK